MLDVDVCLWLPDSLDALADALARKSGLNGERREGIAGGRDIESACAALGLEAEPVELRGADLEAHLRQAPPAVIALPQGYLALAGAGRNWIRMLCPDLRVRKVSLADLRAILCRDAEAPHAGEINRMVDACGITGGRRDRVRDALLRERLRSTRIGRVWQLRVPPGADFIGQAREAGLLGKLAVFAGSHGVEYGFWLLSWWLLGQGALNGRPDRGWLLAWALLLVTMAPLRMLMLWMQGQLAVGAGGLLKQRLLAGALRLNQDLIRHQGSGQLLGRVIESQSVESLALGGGLNAVAAAVELLMAAVVLAAGAGGWLHLALFAGWISVAGLFGWSYRRRRESWTAARLRMTDDLVERMTGHRTRLAQEDPAAWHTEEDRALEEYLHQSAAMDRENTRLVALVPRGWLLVGLVGLAPAFVDATGPAAASLAVGLGGIILGQRALKKLCGSITQLVGFGISWRAVKPLFDAARMPMDKAGAAASTIGSSAAAIDAHDLTFRYHERGEPVLRGASLRIERGDRVLLEGESGGGKSTLASLLVGLRDPASGMLLAGGLDMRTLGRQAWRKRVVAAPQYHENHILSAPFSFNLLMGRAWPPTEADLKEAGEVCRELGLGPLLERMPGGMHQMVGETGWQLSQGERSRVFMARALLQDAELVVLDESFAALDPENLRRALECVLKRARTLVVVAHP